ncbi:ACL066Cp [Eremothecium gossypii ATCC 10895]|uniref:Ubiquitin-like-conjugating enzyme ATG10 n=1 Tax=Eremothecium gossypii (strain ATCC 10895 / CBS 109.51 / FGSC 9923 / NRRL Y-1056) TaxID=284811 RepID=ATG10_EREGS|nr:ACL066Cp [Eremothecium gossypii ATCC 10895]Q75CI5.2 RecName: Full=Ubiquitin-like-conjugating enzyme ATG10; AltName: Full=Autophagy-related protein 10 [Eremothecium gossypii ATCC 10895]AAS51162.2 ACL066Cp [Eremothecium gossypii ATCC 10895]AEY95453.1 FACL066Cp [Eremothecium gossypii FDAG1]
MLSAEDFSDQVLRLLPLLRRWRRCEHALWDPRARRLQLSVATARNSARFDVRVDLHPLYAVPQLLLRYWEPDPAVSEYEVWKLHFVDPYQLPLWQPGRFSIALDQVPATSGSAYETWYVVNSCDTDANVGPETDNYMLRWFSLYGQLLDENLGFTLAAALVAPCTDQKKA